jgi:integrase
MSDIDCFLQAATRENTQQSYKSAIRDFEVEWGGFLPTTPDRVARYLANRADKHAANTLRQRLAALAKWHLDQGFPDPTKAPVVRQVLRGIQTLYPAQEKRAKPFQIDQLKLVDRLLTAGADAAQAQGALGAELRYRRNKALFLLGFWRGFRGDELTRLQIEHVHITPGEGMICFLPRTKGDRQFKGGNFKVPLLSSLCPVTAYDEWITAAALQDGPVFRAIDRWGNIRATGLNIDSLVPILRTILKDAGVNAPDLYSAHSLRRGFASWATANGWDLSTLMEHVGWKNAQSAMRYIDREDSFNRLRIEHALRPTEGK